jgi:hypothetical protein
MVTAAAEQLARDGFKPMFLSLGARPKYDQLIAWKLFIRLF